MITKKRWYLTFALSLCLLLGSQVIYADTYDGYTLYNNNGSRTTNLLDMDNRVVHSWNHDRSGGYSVYLLENGNLLRPAAADNPSIRGGGYAGLIQVKDWDGDLVWEFEYNTNSVMTHHDFAPMPNGNVLAIAWESISSAEANQAGKSRASSLLADHIIEVEPDGNGGGNIVWEWHVWDHLIQDYNANMDSYGDISDHPELLDVNMIEAMGGPGGGDWLHINGINYNPVLDQIIISSHFSDEFYVMDHSTTTAEAASHEGGNSGHGGDFLYRWGNPSNYDTNGNHVFDVVHCVTWIPEGLPGAGHILAFNNGEGNRASEVIELVPPLDDEGHYILEDGEAYGPDAPVWTYSNGRTFYSNHLGGCQRLPNGNTLISESTEGHLFEIDEEGNILWEFDDRNEIARSLRYGLDFPGVFNLRDLDAGDIVINEFLADNGETVSDQDGEFDGWIELYNNTDIEQSLTGFYLSNDADNPTLWEFPDVSIAANDYLVIWADNDLDQDGLHAGFELSADGGSIIFSALDESVLDEVEYNEQATDRSMGRYPNGTGDFTEMVPSFAAENQGEEEPPDYTQIVINELLVVNATANMDQSGEYDAWIELYNNGDESLSLNGLYLSNNAEDLKLWTFPDVQIEAHGYLIIWADEDIEQEGLHANFTLPVDGGSLILSDPDAEEIDNVAFEAQTADISLGRYPNGTGDFTEMLPSYMEENNDDPFSVDDNQTDLPQGFSLLNNYPNPFNPSTTISFRLANAGEVSLKVYDAKGNLVANLLSGSLAAGNHEAVWHGVNQRGIQVSSGIYFYTLKMGHTSETRKALLIR